MKLHQLRYLAAVAQSGLNITAAAQKLHTSQPGSASRSSCSRTSSGSRSSCARGATSRASPPPGSRSSTARCTILQEAQSIRDLSTELRDEGRGSLSIGTTHTQARYVLPDVIRRSASATRTCACNLHQGTSEQIAEMAAARPHRLRHRHRLASSCSRT